MGWLTNINLVMGLVLGVLIGALLLLGVLALIFGGFGALVAAIIDAVRETKRQGVSKEKNFRLLDIAERRYASGEISKEEYNQFKEYLS